MAQSRGMVTDFTAMIDKCKDLDSKKTAPKGSMPAFFKSAAKASEDAKTMTKKIVELIDDASPAQGPTQPKAGGANGRGAKAK